MYTSNLFFWRCALPNYGKKPGESAVKGEKKPSYNCQINRDLNKIVVVVVAHAI